MRLRVNYKFTERATKFEEFTGVRTTSWYTATENNGFTGLIVYYDNALAPNYISAEQIESVWTYEN